MNSDGLTVTFRTMDGQLITAPIIFEGDRAFAVIYEYGPKNTKEIVGMERMELDVRFLQKMDRKHGADFIYKMEPTLPDPKKN